jgi:predicted metal-dependent phosphoesterase TrpH
MRDRADLHVHSNISDGIHSPSELVEIAANLELGALALTDHDTIDGRAEFLNAYCPDYLMKIPGVEISTEYHGKEIHVLGYFVPDSPVLKTKLKWLEEAREHRFPKMIHKLWDLGIEVTKEDVDQVLEGVTSPGRPHLARILVQKEVVKDINEAFDLYLGKGKPAYVKKQRMDTTEAIILLRSLGAVPVVAHPLTIPVLNPRHVLIELMDCGLLGVEVNYDYSHVHVEGDSKDVRSIVKGLGLIETGGSDHHGDITRSNLGDITVPIDVAKQLQAAATNLRKPNQIGSINKL